MNDRAQRFFENIRGKRVAIVGVGVTNTGVAKLLCQKGAKVTVRDRRSEAQLGETAKELQAAGASLKLGEDYLTGPDDDIYFRAPGVYFNKPELQRLRQQGAIVTSEMEVFFDLCPCRTFAVTGSDGKTTTTTLIAELLKKAGYRVHLGGNIGRALLPIIEEIRPEDMAVVELSSFQLLSMRCAPDVSAITNVTPNHLDVHKNMAEYADAKKNIFLHQNAFSKTVLNLDNACTLGFCPEVRGRLFGFSCRTRPQNGTFLAPDGTLHLLERGSDTRLMAQEDILLPGGHNVENYLAALAATSEYVSPEAAREVARTFRGVEHRIEFVREKNGVRWYNDSIATSPSRTIAGLHAFKQKLILIAGGSDKNIPFAPLAPEINRNVKTLILTGATAQKIEEAVTSSPEYNPAALTILHARDMADAVRQADAAAQPGDIVSLSPACASFDSYPNFEARGEHFKELVHAL